MRLMRKQGQVKFLVGKKKLLRMVLGISQLRFYSNVFPLNRNSFYKSDWLLLGQVCGMIFHMIINAGSAFAQQASPKSFVLNS